MINILGSQLSPSSKNLVPAQAGKVTIGLASHWPCITDTVVYPPMGSTAKDRGMSTHAYAPLRHGIINLFITIVPFAYLYMSTVGRLVFRVDIRLGVSVFPFSAWHLVGWQEGHLVTLKSCVCWYSMLVWWFGWSFGRFIAPAVSTTSIIFSSNVIQNGNILVPAYPGCPGKWPLNECCVIMLSCHY